MRALSFALLAISALGTASFQPAPAQQPQDHLANNTVLIIRHSEKPETGNGLTAQGEERARLYVKYFRPFQDQQPPIEVDSLYAGADSKSSLRPRLTLEPLSKATNLPINSSISSKDSTALVAELRSQPHGHCPLISWRHGDMPALLTAFGASPDRLLPNGQWPDDVFDWVIILTIGPDGQLVSQRLIHQRLTLKAAP